VPVGNSSPFIVLATSRLTDLSIEISGNGGMGRSATHRRPGGGGCADFDWFRICGMDQAGMDQRYGHGGCGLPDARSFWKSDKSMAGESTNDPTDTIPRNTKIVVLEVVVCEHWYSELPLDFDGWSTISCFSLLRVGSDDQFQV
jgi:hypothetical protein